LLTIAWDVDDVLNDLTRLWFEKEWLLSHPGCKAGFAELKQNPPHQILGVTLEEYLSSLDAFRLSVNYERLEPLKEAVEWFNEYGGNFRHIALTAVPLTAAPRSASWVLAHFGKWIRTFHFIPSARSAEGLVEYDRDKGAYLGWLKKADILVEDKEENIRSAAKAGVRGILIPRPWNNARGSFTEALKI